MRRVAAIGALALVCVSAAAAAPPQPGVTHVQVPKGTPVLQWGQQLFGANCVTCHGPNGRGISSPVQGAGDQTGLGPSLVGVGAQAADFYLRTGYMPLQQVGTEPRRSTVLFSEDEIRALVAYVASLGNGPGLPRPRPERGDVSDGLKLFTDHCAGCHQIVARGGFLTGGVAPALDRATPRQIAQAIRIGPYLMPRFSRKQISPAQVDSIVRYVEYAKNPDDRGGWAIGHIGPVPEGLVTWFLAAAALVAVCVLLGKRLGGE